MGLKGLELLPTTLNILSLELVHLLVIINIRRQFKKLNNTRHGLKLGTGWDASIGYLVPLQHKTRMILLLGPTCLNSSSHLGIR